MLLIYRSAIKYFKHVDYVCLTGSSLKCKSSRRTASINYKAMNNGDQQGKDNVTHVPAPTLAEQQEPVTNTVNCPRCFYFTSL